MMRNKVVIQSLGLNLGSMVGVLRSGSHLTLRVGSVWVWTGVILKAGGYKSMVQGYGNVKG